MPTIKNIFIATISTCMLLLASTSNASIVITGTTESKKLSEKYTLKNLSSLTHKTATFATLKSNLEFKGFVSNNNYNSVYNTNTAAYLQYNKGNVSYIIPYKYKVILPKFKTPSPNN